MKRWPTRSGSGGLASAGNLDRGAPRFRAVEGGDDDQGGLWPTREVGQHVHSVKYVATQLGVSWHTAMDAVMWWGQALVEDPTVSVPPRRRGG